jgi:hypothetical protein
MHFLIFLENKNAFLSNLLWEFILLRADRDCAPRPPNMFSGLFVATLARDVR